MNPWRRALGPLLVFLAFIPLIAQYVLDERSGAHALTVHPMVLIAALCVGAYGLILTARARRSQ